MALNPSIQFNFRSRQLLLRSAHPEGRTRRHFLSVPHSWGTRDLANLTAICNLQYEYNNIFIKVLQGHPGKNQTTTREESCGALAHPQQLAFLGHHSSQCGAHRWRSQVALSREPAGGSRGGSTWSREDIHSGSTGPGARGSPAGDGSEADTWSCLPRGAVPPPPSFWETTPSSASRAPTSGSAKGALL